MSSLRKDMHQENLIRQAVEHNRELIKSLFRHVGELEAYLLGGWIISTDTIEAEHRTWKTVKWEAVVDSSTPESLEYVELLTEHVSLGNSIQQIKDRLQLQQDVAKAGKWVKGKSRPLLDIAREGESAGLIGCAGPRWPGKQYGIRQPASAPLDSEAAAASKEPPLREFFQGSAIFGPSGILGTDGTMAGESSATNMPHGTGTSSGTGRESSRANEVPRPRQSLKPGLTFKKKGTSTTATVDEGPPPKSAAASKDNKENPHKSVFSSMHYVHTRDTARASRASDANRAFGTFGSFRATGTPRINEDPLASVSARADDVYMGRTAPQHEEVLGLGGTTRDVEASRSNEAPSVGEVLKRNTFSGPTGASGFSHVPESSMVSGPPRVSKTSRMNQSFEENPAFRPTLAPKPGLAPRADAFSRPKVVPRPRLAPKLYQSSRTIKTPQTSGIEQQPKMREVSGREWQFRPSMYSEAGHVHDYPSLSQRLNLHGEPQVIGSSGAGGSPATERPPSSNITTEVSTPRMPLGNRGVSDGSQPHSSREVIDLTIDTDDSLDNGQPVSSSSLPTAQTTSRPNQDPLSPSSRALEMETAAVQAYIARRARERAAVEDYMMGIDSDDSDEDYVMEESDYNPNTRIGQPLLPLPYNRPSLASQTNPFVQARRHSELDAPRPRESFERPSVFDAPKPKASFESPSVFSPPPPRQNPFESPRPFHSAWQEQSRRPIIELSQPNNFFTQFRQPSESRKQQDSSVLPDTQPSQNAITLGQNMAQPDVNMNMNMAQLGLEPIQQQQQQQQLEAWMMADPNAAQWPITYEGLEPWLLSQTDIPSEAPAPDEEEGFDAFLTAQAGDWVPGAEWPAGTYWMERPGAS